MACKRAVTCNPRMSTSGILFRFFLKIKRSSVIMFEEHFFLPASFGMRVLLLCKDSKISKYVVTKVWRRFKWIYAGGYISFSVQILLYILTHLLFSLSRRFLLYRHLFNILSYFLFFSETHNIFLHCTVSGSYVYTILLVWG